MRLFLPTKKAKFKALQFMFVRWFLRDYKFEAPVFKIKALYPVWLPYMGLPPILLPVSMRHTIQDGNESSVAMPEQQASSVQNRSTYFYESSSSFQYAIT